MPRRMILGLGPGFARSLWRSLLIELSLPRIIQALLISGPGFMHRDRSTTKIPRHRSLIPMARYIFFFCLALASLAQADLARAQTNKAFSDAYGAMIGPGSRQVTGKDFFVSQQSNMADRGSTNAGVNPRGNVDVNPPGFIGDNPFGNSSVPNP